MFDEASEFRDFLNERGHDLMSRSDFTYYLDLNQGGMRIDSDKENLLKFVADMKEFFGEKQYTEMNAINQLVAERRSILAPDQRIYWHRPYHVDYNENPEKWISFKEHVTNLN